MPTVANSDHFSHYVINLATLSVFSAILLQNPCRALMMTKRRHAAASTDYKSSISLPRGGIIEVLIADLLVRKLLPWQNAQDRTIIQPLGYYTGWILIDCPCFGH